MFAFIRKMLGAAPSSSEATSELGKARSREVGEKETLLTADSLVTLSGDNFLRYIEDRISRQLLTKLAAGVATVITLAGAGAFLFVGDFWRDAAKKQSQETLKEVLPSELAKTLVFSDPVKSAFNTEISKQENLLKDRAKTIVDEALNPKKIEELVRQSLEHTSSVTQQIAARYKAVAMDGGVEIDRRETALKTFTIFGQQNEIRDVLEDVVCQRTPQELKLVALHLYEVPKDNAGAADRIVQSAIQDPNTVTDNDLSSAYVTCLATFKATAVPALIKASQAPQIEKHLSLVAKTLAKIGTPEALDTLLRMAEQQTPNERMIGWQSLADFQTAGIEFEKRKDAIERSFKMARSAPVLSPPKTVSIDSIARIERLLTAPDAWSTALEQALPDSVFMSLYRRRLAQRELRIREEPISTRAVRNLVGTTNPDGWEFLVRKFWPTDWSKPNSAGDLELILSLWLPLQEGTTTMEGRSKIASLVLSGILLAPEPFSTLSRRRAIDVALRGCPDEGVKSFFNKFLGLARGKTFPAAEGAKKSTIAPLLITAIERDNKMNPRFGQLHGLLSDWKKGSRDWPLGADIAAALGAPVAAGDSRAFNYLFECIKPPIHDDPQRWPAAYNALITLKDCDQDTIGQVVDQILAFIASLEGIDGKENAKGEKEKLHGHIEEAALTLNRLAHRAPRAILDKVFQRLQGLAPAGEAPTDGPGFSEARYHLINVLAVNGYAAAIPTVNNELISGFDDEDWHNAENTLLSLANLIKKVAPSAGPAPAKMSSLGLNERRRANLEWARWWEGVSGVANTNLDKIILLAQGTNDQSYDNENDAEKDSE